MSIFERIPAPLGAPVGWTFCSGIGAPEVAAPFVDWRLASEIEPFPRAVLQDRLGYALPEDHNQGDPLLWGDMTEVNPDLARSRGVPLPNLIVAGTPCQAFSLAGARKGVSDPRGGLTLKFVEICHATVDARLDGKLAVLWENVPGVLSDKENAFGCFLGGLVGGDDPLLPPGGGNWPGSGMVSGPRARLAWRVCDAQYFGVPQRRRRVFVVVDFGGACDPAAVLFERKGLRGHSAPRREQGQDVAGTLSARSEGGGGLGTDMELAGGLMPSDVPAEFYGGGNTAGPLEVTACLTAGQRMDFEVETFAVHPAVCVTGDRTHALTAEGHDASEDGTGRGTPVIAFSSKDFGADATEELCPTLRAGGHANSHANAGNPPAIAFDTTQITSPGNVSNPKPGDPCHPLAADAHPPALAGVAMVRRLMPVECERLQGFPDGWTEISWRKRVPEDCPDGPRYKALGNSMAVPNMAWILERLRASAGWP